jgi:hypothetical protein
MNHRRVLSDSRTAWKLEVSCVERCVTLQLLGCVLNWICEVLSNGKALRQERHTNRLVPFVVRTSGKFKNIKMWLHNVMLNAIKTARKSRSDITSDGQPESSPSAVIRGGESDRCH